MDIHTICTCAAASAIDATKVLFWQAPGTRRLRLSAQKAFLRALSCLAAIAILCSLCACADLSEVRQFAALSSKVEKFPISEDDISATYDNQLSNFREKAILFGEVADTAPKEAQLAFSAEEKRAKIAHVKALNIANGVIVAYLNVLGELADNKTSSEIGKNFADTLEVINVKGSEIKKDNVSTIINLLIAKAFEGYRSEKVNEFIIKGKDDFVAIVNGLGSDVNILKKNFMDETLQLSLTGDGNYFYALENFYKTSKKTAQDVAAMTWIRQQRGARVKELNEKMRAIEEYADNLGKIKNKHKKLLESESNQKNK
ncbi:MAG: hypothetical protein LBV54_04845 [Puniceicoccales bacterium]|nr:hypothetical protein [Puniceicoccales bacterium]